MPSLIENLLSGQTIRPRQSMQQPMDIGSLMGFISRGHAQMPQLPQPEQGGGHADLGSILALFNMYKKSKDKDEAQEYMKQLIGKPNSPMRTAPYKDAYKPTNDGVGLLGGKMSMQELAAGLMSSPDENVQASGMQMFQDMAKPRTQPSIHAMGAPGKPGYKVNFILGPNNEAIPVGEPFKESAGVVINNLDKIPPPSPGYMWNKDGTSQSFIPGGPHDPVGRQPTQAEDTASKFGKGMYAASKRLDEALLSYDIEKSNTQDRVARFLGDGFGDIGSQAANAIKTPGRRLVDQAASEFRQFALTAMTGAAYSQDQKDDILRGMIPTDSDDDETRKVKAQARADFIYSTIQASLPVLKRDGDKVSSKNLPVGKAIGQRFKSPDGVELIFRGNQGGMPIWTPADGLEKTKPVDRATSKSGKPMIKVNGIWEYE